MLVLVWLIGVGEVAGEGGGFQVIRGAEVGVPVTPTAFVSDLRELAGVKPWRPGDPVRDIPHGGFEGIRPAGPDEFRDPLLERSPDRPLRSVIVHEVGFDGIPFTGSSPPDPMGDVGKNHYIHAVNGSFTDGVVFQVFDKLGTALTGIISLSSLGSGNCAGGVADPVVVYDHLADRWLLAELPLTGMPDSGYLCVYISQTADPVSGGWYAYEFEAPYFPDYPKYGVWPNAYFVSTNEAYPDEVNAVYALQRAQMLNGEAAAWQRFEASQLSGFYFHSMTVAELDGATPPPAGAPGIFMRHHDTEIHGTISDPANDYLELWEFDVDWDTPADSTFSGPTLVATSEFDSTLCPGSYGECIQQPSPGGLLDPRAEVVLWKVQYRNRGEYQHLSGNFTVDVSADEAGIRWFELRDEGSGWHLFQEGTYSPDATHRWNGSVATDSEGNMALGYNRSSLSTNPGIGLTGRSASDPAGLMTEPETELAGGLSHFTGTNRWGDYSAMTLDPSDDCTFWYTNQFVVADGNWGTRVSSFNFSSCGLIFSDGFESGDTDMWQ